LGYAWKGIEAWFNVLNIADERYATQASKAGTRKSYNVGEERSLNAGIAYHLGGAMQ
jgi:hypothetical protein